jgi:hypothetical protein
LILRLGYCGQSALPAPLHLRHRIIIKPGSKEIPMTRLLFLILALAFGTAAHGAGLPFAVGSLEKAKEVAKQDASKHVLIFYSSPY